MAWTTPQWCIYDIPNELVIWCRNDQYPTDEEIKRNVFKMPTAQVAMIRKTKGLPMPCPPVDVVVWREAGIEGEPYKGNIND